MFQALARAAEEAGLNASAPPQEARVDGWLIRLSPGKAKRSRCVNALAAGDTPLDDLLARCRQAFDAAQLPLIVRITPFSEPADLDEQLAAKGWLEFDPANVMVRPHLDALPVVHERLQAIDATRYAQIVGELRGSSKIEISAHAERMLAAPVPYQGFVLQGSAGQLLACGQIVREGDIVGLYDIFTPPEQRGLGHAQQLCSALLQTAKAQGAVQAYLQVGSDNETAKRLYTRLGFTFAYRYHYRSDNPGALG
jgi:ribosomal protein S18 acetylase RimI-like enzyme